MPQEPENPVGKVYLVGAGPGDPRLITVRGAECLSRADLVLHDCLVNPVLLNYAPPSAQRVCLGPVHTPGRSMSQREINARMLEAVRQGETVVRLKGGDPSVFGRCVEETEALAAAGVAWETVPGVTAAIAAAGYAAIPITHGRQCSAVALVTGHQRQGKSVPPLDYGALAQFPGTLILYMGVATAGQWSQALIDGGKSPDTPVAVVRRCTWADQQTVRCTLQTVAEAIRQHDLRPPAVIIIGEVVALASDVSWYTTRPLFGTRVLLTRAHQQIDCLSQQFTELGADVLLQPAIRIADPPDWQPVDAALARLDRYDWLVFSSVNGVRFLLERLYNNSGDLRRLGRVKLAAIGPSTADELGRFHLRADLVPDQYRAEALAEALIAACWPGSPPGDQTGKKRFLLARASRGRQLLAEQLTAAGAEVDQVVVYSSLDVQQPDPAVAAAMATGRIDWVTVTSSAIAGSLVAMFGEKLRQTKLASISPVTSQTLRDLGCEPSAEAAPYTMEGLIRAILDHR